MAEMNVQLKGWQAIVAAVVLVVLVGFRFVTMKDQSDNKELVRKLEMDLMSEYYLDMAERMKTAVASGDEDRISKVASSVTSTKLKIEEVSTSSPMFEFSTSKNVVVKVVYSLVDSSGTRETRTQYFLYKHGAIGNSWSLQRESNQGAYYLNFR